MKYKGLFVTLEGVEGAGKTTQINRLAKALGENVVITYEPGGTPISERIREIFLSSPDITPHTELMLIAAARSQHVNDLILPALVDGSIVICDRFSDATVAYQGYRKGIDLKVIKMVNDIATGGLKPDITFLLDLPPKVGLQRKREADEPLTRFELETLDSHEKVRNGYLAVAEAEPNRVIVINALLDVDEILRMLIKECKKKIHSIFNRD